MGWFVEWKSELLKIWIQQRLLDTNRQTVERNREHRIEQWMEEKGYKSDQDQLRMLVTETKWETVSEGVME